MTAFAQEMQKRTKQFALRVIAMSDSLPRKSSGYILGKQVLRSATSVGANYREAQRARSTAEFRAKIGDCLKEAEETAYWLDLICESALLAEARLGDLRRESSELIAIFVSILNAKRRSIPSEL